MPGGINELVKFCGSIFFVWFTERSSAAVFIVQELKRVHQLPQLSNLCLIDSVLRLIYVLRKLFILQSYLYF